MGTTIRTLLLVYSLGLGIGVTDCCTLSHHPAVVPSGKDKPGKDKPKTITNTEAVKALSMMINDHHANDELLRLERKRLGQNRKIIEQDGWFHLANTKWHPMKLRFVIRFFNHTGVPIIEYVGRFHLTPAKEWKAVITKTTRFLQ